MSRAYRIRVRETLRRVVKAEDHVRSQLELLEILPKEQMAGLLAEELARRGFEREGGRAVRRQGELAVSVDLATGEVTVAARVAKEVELAKESQGYADADAGGGRRQAEQRLRESLRDSLEKSASKHERDLRKQATDALEAQLGDVTAELDQAVNRATAEALKRKAAQLGQIKQMTDDPESGSLTIVVEL